MKLEKVENSLGKMIKKSLSILADCSFGIFFIHNYFVLLFLFITAIILLLNHLILHP